MDTFIISAIVMGVICAFIGGNINTSKGRSYGEGFIICLLLGIIGLIIVAVLPQDESSLKELRMKDGTSKKCPYCAEIIKSEAIVCKHCGRDVPIQEKQQEIEHESDVDLEKKRVEKMGIEVVKCPNCGTLNSLALLECENCRTNLGKVKPIHNPYF